MHPLMTMISWTDAAGYGAMFFVILSFLFSDARKLRMVNTLGCALFIIYGSLQGSMPVVITNLVIVLINLFHLMKGKVKG